MKRLHKIGLISVGLLAITFIASSCTASFCTEKDKGRILFAVEPGVSTYYDTEDEADAALGGPLYGTDSFKEKVEGANVWRVVGKTGNNYFQMVDPSTNEYVPLTQLETIINNAATNGSYRPSDRYFAALDQKVLVEAFRVSEPATGIKLADADAATVRAVLTDYGYVKFYDNNLWDNYNMFNEQLAAELPGGVDETASYGFISAYKTALETVANANRACITTYTGQYGNYGQFHSTVTITEVTWGDAWHKGGAVIEGLIVYPVAWMVDQFAHMFAGGNDASLEAINAAYQTGVPQLLALLVVTVIVRLFIFLVSFKSTLSQQKMQQLQPEIAKIQQKYPNSNTNQAQKQRLAEEQMKLYKKHHINPLSQFLVLIIQFPVFIGVWGAMTGSAVLSTGSVLNLNLSTSIWNALTNTAGLPSNTNGWWTALVLIILMSVAQFFAMKIPQWMAKARTKKLVARLGKNPAQTQQNRTATMISYAMLVMIIVMGFTLPAAMGIYWFIGALISLAQSLIIQLIFAKKPAKK